MDHEVHGNGMVLLFVVFVICICIFIGDDHYVMICTLMLANTLYDVIF